MGVALSFRRALLYAYQTRPDGRCKMPYAYILATIGQALDTSRAYFWRGAHHYPLDRSGDWTLAIRPENAGRIRFDTCYLGVVRATKWSLESDDERIVAVALDARDEVLAEV